MSAAELALFPLGTVLFPGGPLRLRIFEPRYLDMVRRCLKESRAFGVVLILEGEEAGAAASVATTGTNARVVDFDALPDGLLGIDCLGEQRFRVARRTTTMPAGSPTAGRKCCRSPPPRSSSCSSSTIRSRVCAKWPRQPGSPRLRMYSPRYLRRT